MVEEPVEDLIEGGRCGIERSSPLRHFSSEVVAPIAVVRRRVREYSDANLVVEPPLLRR
jgi:hypothetical protein